MLTLPPPVEAIIEWWLPQVRDLLGDDLLSVVLYGSVTLGDYQAGWSDIDVCVVLSDSIGEDAGARLGHIHDRMQQRYLEHKHGGWLSGQVVESNYVPQSLAANSVEDKACYIAGGTTRKWQRGDPLLPFDRYMLANFGQSCFGSDVHFEEPGVELLCNQAETDLHSLHSWKNQSAIWLTGMLHWFARSIVFWRDGTMLSKTAALLHEIERGSIYTEPLELALTIRREGSTTAVNYMDASRNHYSRFADSFFTELQQVIVASRPG